MQLKKGSILFNPRGLGEGDFNPVNFGKGDSKIYFN
jgi:hypothetical protein